MRRAKGTGCITQMSNGRYKYRGLLRVGVNKNGNPKNKIFYGNTKREVENKINAYLNQDEPEIKEVLTFNDALDLLYHQSKKERVKQKTLSVIETTSKVLRKKWGEVSITNIFAKEVEDQFLLWESEYSFSQLQKLRNYAKKAFRVICEIYGVDLKNPFDLKIKSPDNAPKGCSSLQAEIFFDSKTRIPNKNEVLENTIKKLCDMGIFSKDDIVVSDIRFEKYANVTFDHNIYKNRDMILEFLRQSGIESIGRFGKWEYLWTHQAFKSGMDAAKN